MGILDSCYKAVVGFNSLLTYPALILFLGTAIFLTLKLRFIQFRGFSRIIKLLTSGIPLKKTTAQTLNPFQALFSAMSSTIGMGNIIGPSMAISIGGPGALFWLILYILIGSATKYAEVTFSVFSRSTSSKGSIIGGPTQYLKLISPYLGSAYAVLTVILFTIWSSVQVNTLSCIWLEESIPAWVAGAVCSTFLLAVVLGGVKRIGSVMSKIVPLKFLLYVFFAIMILLSNISLILPTLKLIIKSAFTYQSAAVGFAGATVLQAMREGIYKGIFVTESGAGTASIAHALADVKYPSDQGLLALYSGVADMLLCLLSGLVTLVTGVWMSGKLGNILIYEAFKSYSPGLGKYILLISVLLFVISAIIGNTYNGSQSFASLVGFKHIKTYYIFAALIAFTGAISSMPVVWQLMDVILALVAFANLIGLIILSIKYPQVLAIKDNNKDK